MLVEPQATPNGSSIGQNTEVRPRSRSYESGRSTTLVRDQLNTAFCMLDDLDEEGASADEREVLHIGTDTQVTAQVFSSKR
jgi:hypothetical protein